MTLSLKGTATALVTPFNQDGSVDLGAFEALVHWQIENGIDVLVPCGTTGESATVSNDERKSLIETAVKASNGRAPVVAGTGGNDTEKLQPSKSSQEKPGQMRRLLLLHSTISRTKAGFALITKRLLRLPISRLYSTMYLAEPAAICPPPQSTSSRPFPE